MRILHNKNKLVDWKFYLTLCCFHARIQSSTCTTYMICSLAVAVQPCMEWIPIKKNVYGKAWSQLFKMLKSGNESKKSDEKLVIHNDSHFVKSVWKLKKPTIIWKFLLALHIKQELIIYHQIWSIFNPWNEIAPLMSVNYLPQFFLTKHDGRTDW